MPVTSASKSQNRQIPLSVGLNETPPELRFIADMGRSLLFTVHPKKVACRVADAIQSGTGAELCAFVAELENIGVVSCAFDQKGEVVSEFLDRKRFEKWLDLLPPQVGYTEEDKQNFLLSGSLHSFEYVSPLHINGEIKGAIVVGFTAKSDFTDGKGSLIDAATQMAAMSVNPSTAPSRVHAKSIAGSPKRSSTLCLYRSMSSIASSASSPGTATARSECRGYRVIPQ
jgi:hypothetical protein